MANTTHDPLTEAAGPDIHPADILMNLVVSFLAPMFLIDSGGNIQFARMAATQTVQAYAARNLVDLLSIAQIIGFGLAALRALNLSMADNLSVPMILRLHSSANALNRSAEQNRRTLQRTTATTAPDPVEPGHQAFDEADLIARVAATKKMAEQAIVQTAVADTTVAGTAVVEPPTAQPAASERPTTQLPAVPPTATPPADPRRQTMWGAAMANVAAELAAGLVNLPPAERRVASIRAAALSSTANALISGSPVTLSQPLFGLRPPGQQT